MIRHANTTTLGTILSVTDQDGLLKTSVQTEVKIVSFLAAPSRQQLDGLVGRPQSNGLMVSEYYSSS